MEKYIIHNGQFYSPNELMHYGVLGMKWGVRRYRNEDGSYTPAGQRRNYKTVKRLAKKMKMGGIGDTVGNDETVTSLADKINPLQARREAARQREYSLINKQESEDRKKFADFYVKNGRDPNQKEYKKMQQETYRKYKKDISIAEKEVAKLDAEYKSTVKQVVDDFLGKYGEKQVAGHRWGSQEAAKWLTTELEWGNATRSFRSEK